MKNLTSGERKVTVVSSIITFVFVILSAFVIYTSTRDKNETKQEFLVFRSEVDKKLSEIEKAPEGEKKEEKIEELSKIVGYL